MFILQVLDFSSESGSLPKKDVEAVDGVLEEGR